MSSGQERRRRARHVKTDPAEVHIGLVRSNGGVQAIKGRLVDASEWGVGVETPLPLEVGLEVTVSSSVFPGQQDGARRRKARVVHCRVSEPGSYRTGCAFEEYFANRGRYAERPQVDASVADYYETLQVSSNADNDTIQRVYRMLAQRYHPDNADTGNEAAFRAVLQAYKVLSDPEKRAAYDVEYHAAKSLRWKIFDQTKSTQGLEAEKRKRSGLLALLYTKMMEDSRNPGLMLRELEELLGCPREHLDFTLWYLKQKGMIAGPENGRYSITVAGIDSVEERGDYKFRPMPLMLEEAKQEETPAETKGR
jgi:DnaJ-domain-containing protein 1